MKISTTILVVSQTALLVCGCTSSVKTDPSKLAQVSIKKSGTDSNAVVAKKVNGEYSPELVTQESSAANVKIDVDMEAEGVISRECLEAWEKRWRTSKAEPPFSPGRLKMSISLPA